MTSVSSSFDAATHPLEGIVPDIEREILGPIIDDINRLKAERNAVVIAHNYMTPDIFYGVADLRGDSLQLARMAAETDADVIVMAGVHFMAETAKILSPDKTVLIPTSGPDARSPSRSPPPTSPSSARSIPARRCASTSTPPPR